MEEEGVRWSIKVSKYTDLTLRTFLGAQSVKKGDLSKFIEEAVGWRVLQCTIQDIGNSGFQVDAGGRRASPLSLRSHLPERSSPSRVRFAAQNRRALDNSGPF